MKSAVIWVHGLGDTGAGWHGAFNQVESQRKTTKFYHPDAPRQPVSCNGGCASTSWFDIIDIPVGLSEPQPPQGIDTSVEKMHELIEKVKAEGVPAQNIILGGFSQGGTMALLAGLKYPETLAGVISISGWCAYRDDVASQISDAAKKTPVLMCCGDGDPVVDFSITKKSADLLEGVLEKIEVMTPRRGMHQPDQTEFRRVMQFMLERLPE
eukprot:TRINITY_DN103300_c0_g1_i1.p1 TRINITY_DN103300_c0_g1~~TRINITY_DN103300_c0_g1_i1.p1  ORF type:complete len:211 (+),score=40.21 TRINITY_DN103300_c0_g1_i1:111-743(+)